MPSLGSVDRSPFLLVSPACSSIKVSFLVTLVLLVPGGFGVVAARAVWAATGTSRFRIWAGPF